MTSIRKNLLVSISIVFAFSTIVAAIIILYTSNDEASEVFDGNMMQIAQAISHSNNGSIASSNKTTLKEEEEILIQVWSLSGELEYSSHPKIIFGNQNTSGYGQIIFQDTKWRYYSLEADNQIIQIAQPLWIRNDLILELGLSFIIPILLQFPIIILFVWLSVARGTEPLVKISTSIAKRQVSDLSFLETSNIPNEIKPLIVELNSLFLRLQKAMQMQKNFTSDAAHELRTPLTAIKLYTDMLERTTEESKRTDLFEKLQSSIKRSTHLINQMLVLSRQDPETIAQSFGAVDLCDIVQKSLDNNLIMAEAKDITCKINASSHPITTQGSSDYLSILVDNLIINAINYTPKEGEVVIDIEKCDNNIILKISDNGIGIPQYERENIFKRFYRILGNDVVGSGLGLAIVNEIASAHDATIIITDGLDGKGTSFTINFKA